MEQLKNKIKQVEETNLKNENRRKLVRSMRNSGRCSITTNEGRADFSQEDAEMIADLIKQIILEDEASIKPLKDTLNTLSSLIK